MITYFTSDTHFGDDRLNLTGRDILFKTVDEMDQYIIDRWNSVVKPDDIVYHLGDVAYTLDGLKKVSQLNGIKYLTKGNYDVLKTSNFEISDELLSNYFARVEDSFELIVKDSDDSMMQLHCQHYPVNGVNDSFNLVGHIHGIWKFQRNMMNVSTDAWHFTPISIEQIMFFYNAIKKYYDINAFAGELNINQI